MPTVLCAGPKITSAIAHCSLCLCARHFANIPHLSPAHAASLGRSREPCLPCLPYPTVYAANTPPACRSYACMLCYTSPLLLVPLCRVGSSKGPSPSSERHSDEQPQLHRLHPFDISYAIATCRFLPPPSPGLLYRPEAG